MGINTTLNTALSGLTSSQSQIDVVGNNIANVNTTGYKATTLDFKTQFLQTFSYGSAPSGALGGSNPLQVGLGVTSGTMSTDFTTGGTETNGIPTNLAINGDGFFVLNQGSQQVYTRDGSFQTNDQQQLVSSTGQFVQGYGVDANYNILSGSLTNLTIPLNSAAIAQASTTATYTGNLNADGTLPNSVSNLTSSAMYLSDGAGGVDAVNPPVGGTLLTNVTAANGTPLFQIGDVITLNATMGTASVTNGSTTTTFGSGGVRSITPQTYTVTSSSSLSDIQSFLTGGLGIDTSAGANGPVTATSGTTLVTDPNASNAVDLDVIGNPGYDNNIGLGVKSLSIDRGGTTLNQFAWNTQSSADGESAAFNGLQVFDSLGTALTLNVTATLVSKNSSGSTWQLYATSPDNVGAGGVQAVVGDATISFDTSGNLITTATPTVTINRSNTGADPNLNMSLDVSSLTALSAIEGGSTTSTILGSADGAQAGILNSYQIESDGTIQGTFSNGLKRPLGQVVLATFQNDQGLVADGNNTYGAGPNSGAAVISAPGSGTAGSVTAGALEGSNVDLSGEFVKLISASTAFSASSRVISTSQQLLQALLSAAQG